MLILDKNTSGFFYTRPKFSKWSISASIWSQEDFRTIASTYFFVGNSFPIEIRVFEHSVHHFERVKVITSSANDRVFLGISLIFIEFYRIPLIFFDFCWFSLIFIDFTVVFRKSFRHFDDIEPSKLVEGLRKRFWNT